MDKLSKTDLYLLDLIKSDKAYFTQHNIAELEKKYYTSKGTLLRLVKKCGFENIKQMQIFYAKELNIDLISNVKDNYLQEKHVNDIITNVSGLSISSIIETNKVLDIELIYIASEWIFESKHVILFGSGNSSLSLNYFSSILKRVGMNTSSHTSISGLLTEMEFCKVENTVIVLASNTVKTKEILYILETFKTYNTILIKNHNKQIKQNDRLLILDYVTNKNDKNHFPVISSYCSQIYVINILFNMIIKNDRNFAKKIDSVNSKIDKWNK